MTKTILVPVDFSPQSQAAVDYAAAFAKDMGAELLIVHVVDLELESLQGIVPGDAAMGIYNALHDVKPHDESVPFKHRVLDGRPADVILKTAEEENAEMIVMGTHGRTGLKQMVMGSVATAVVRKSTCPVLTLKTPIPAAEVAGA